MNNLDKLPETKDLRPPEGEKEPERPYTPSQHRLIVSALQKGASNKEVCIETDLHFTEVMEWMAYGDNAELAERLRMTPAWEAKRNLADNIESGDVGNSKWYLTHNKETKADWSDRVEHTGEGGKDLIPVTEEEKKQIEAALSTMDHEKKT